MTSPNDEYGSDATLGKAPWRSRSRGRGRIPDFAGDTQTTSTRQGQEAVAAAAASMGDPPRESRSASTTTSTRVPTPDSTSASPSTPNPRMAAARMDFALRAEDRRAAEDAYNRFLIYFVAPTFLMSMLLSAPVVMVGVWLLIPVLAAAALLSLAAWLKVAADSNARKWRRHWRRDRDEEDPPANCNMARTVVNGDGESPMVINGQGARPMDKGKGKMPMVNGNGSHERIS